MITKKDVVLFFTFVVIPGGVIAATIHYAPKIRKWYVDKKDKKADDNGATK